MLQGHIAVVGNRRDQHPAPLRPKRFLQKNRLLRQRQIALFPCVLRLPKPRQANRQMMPRYRKPRLRRNRRLEPPFRRHQIAHTPARHPQIRQQRRRLRRIRPKMPSQHLQRRPPRLQGRHVITGQHERPRQIVIRYCKLRIGLTRTLLPDQQATPRIVQCRLRIPSRPRNRTQRTKRFAEYRMRLAERRLPDPHTLEMAGFRLCQRPLRAQHQTEIMQAGADTLVRAPQYPSACLQHRLMRCSCDIMLAQRSTRRAEIGKRFQRLRSIFA
jgi:hypothetical protein